MGFNISETHLTKTEKTFFFMLGCLMLILAYFCFRNASIPFIAFGLVLPFLLSFWILYLDTNRGFKEAKECLIKNRIAEKDTEDIEDESRESDWELINSYGPSWLDIMLALYAFSAIPLFSFLFAFHKEEWLFILFILYLSSPLFGASCAISITFRKFRKLSEDMTKLEN